MAPPRHAGPVTDPASAGEAPYDADERTRAGVYANHVELVLAPDEATIDFVRIDHDERAGGRGVLLARVALARQAAFDLKDLFEKLPDVWRTHTGRITQENA